MRQSPGCLWDASAKCHAWHSGTAYAISSDLCFVALFAATCVHYSPQPCWGFEKVSITDNRYDMKEEEYRETIIERYSGKKKEAFIKKINEMLSESPFGPGGYPVITSYERAVAFLKMKSGQKS